MYIHSEAVQLHRAPRAEVQVVRQKMENHNKLVAHLEKTTKELHSSVGSLTEKTY